MILWQHITLRFPLLPNKCVHGCGGLLSENFPSTSATHTGFLKYVLPHTIKCWLHS